MKIGIVIPCFERPEYLRQTLLSLLQSDFADNEVVVVLIDDCSRDPAVKKLLLWFNDVVVSNHLTVLPVFKTKRTGMFNSLQLGFNILIEEECKLLMNIDSDMVMKWDWLLTVKRLHEEHDHLIVTGFDADRHASVIGGRDCRYKKTIGGANLVFSVDIFTQYVSPSLRELHWDWRLCERYKGNLFVSAFPSVMQHIGVVSTVGHHGGDTSTSYE